MKINGCTAKKKGQANAKLLMYPKPYSNEFLWWLLVTDGTGNAEKLEKLKSAIAPKTRLQWLDDYEIVAIMREGRTTPNITWRMTKKCYNAWHTRIRQAIRSNADDKLRQATWSLHRVPGFSELRLQVKQLRLQVIKEHKRSRSNKDDEPLMPKSVSYVTNADTSTVLLSQIVRRMAIGLRPFPKQENAKVLVEN